MKGVWWFHPTQNAVRDREIDRVRASYVRLENALDERSERISEPDDDPETRDELDVRDPGWRSLYGRCKRTSRRLVQMLRRRGRPGDLREARVIELDWPEDAVEL